MALDGTFGAVGHVSILKVHLANFRNGEGEFEIVVGVDLIRVIHDHPLIRAQFLQPGQLLVYL